MLGVRPTSSGFIVIMQVSTEANTTPTRCDVTNMAAAAVLHVVSLSKNQGVVRSLLQVNSYTVNKDQLVLTFGNIEAQHGAMYHRS